MMVVALLSCANVARAESTSYPAQPVVQVPTVVPHAGSGPTDEIGAWQGPLPEPVLAPAARLSTVVMDAWLINPESMLETYPDGGRVMAEHVALLAGSDNRAIAALIRISKAENVKPLQMKAIAEGLATVTKKSQSSAPSYSAYVMLQVAGSGSGKLSDSFNVALRQSGEFDVQTSDIGGGAGSGPTAGSLTGGGRPGTTGGGGDDVVATSSGAFSVQGGSVSYSEYGGTDDSGSEVSRTLPF